MTNKTSQPDHYTTLFLTNQPDDTFLTYKKQQRLEPPVLSAVFPETGQTFISS